MNAKANRHRRRGAWLFTGPNAEFLPRVLTLMLVCVFMTGITSCASKPKPKPMPWEIPQDAKSPDQIKWTYQPKGLTLEITADDNLNPFEGFSHSTLLCIYQLSTPAAFQEMSANVGGLTKLLQCERVDPTTVMAERLFVTPGEKTSHNFDRAEGAAHVGLVAGFYQLEPGSVTLLADFPITERRKHFWSLSHVYNPGTLTLPILLGPDSIQNMGLN